MDSFSKGQNIARLLTVKEVCEILRCNRTKLWILRNSGLIKSLSIGKSVRFTETEINRYITESMGGRKI